MVATLGVPNHLCGTLRNREDRMPRPEDTEIRGLTRPVQGVHRERPVQRLQVNKITILIVMDLSGQAIVSLTQGVHQVEIKILRSLPMHLGATSPRTPQEATSTRTAAKEKYDPKRRGPIGASNRASNTGGPQGPNARPKNFSDAPGHS